MAEDPIISYGFFDFRLDVERQQLLKNGKPVPLTHKAFQILLLLVRNSGHTTTKADIFRQLWSGRFVEESNLTQHIHVLRKVLGQAPSGQSFVETIPKLGYRFTIPSQQISIARYSDEGPNLGFAGVGSGPPTGSLSDGADRLSILLHDFRTRSVGFVGLRSVTFILCVLSIADTLAITAVFYASHTSPDINEVKVIRSIAVLPFKPIGEKFDKVKLGFGLADAVITSLSKTNQVNVRPTSAISRYVGDPAVDAAAAGQDLEVEAVLEGTVQCDGQSLRVSVQLIRVADGKALWAESFQEKVSNVFTMQDSVSAQIAAALSVSLLEKHIVADRFAGKTNVLQVSDQ